MALLVQVIQEGLRPQPAFIHLPMLLQGERATTAVEPMKSLLQMAQAIEKQPGILNAEVLLGHAWSDAAHTGPSVVVIAKDESHLAHARKEAKRLAQSMWDRRGEFTFDQEVIATVDEAIETALGAPESTVFVTDSGDNPTAGAPGDNPFFLSRLLARRVPDAVFAGMPDAEVAGVCFAKGVGATVSVTLGGKLDTAYGMPVPVTGVVEHLYKGDDRTKDASIATLRVGGVRILIPDVRKAFTLLDDFRKAGVNPLEHKIVVEKLGYLMPELRDAAPREIMVLSPGRSDMDLTRLSYQYLTRPCFPLDPDFEWHPIISNIAGYGGQ
jgi:microcystin degradation protein MlrC